MREPKFPSWLFGKISGIRNTIGCFFLVFVLASCNSTGPVDEELLAGSINPEPVPISRGPVNIDDQPYESGQREPYKPSVFNTVSIPFSGPTKLKKQRAIIAEDDAGSLGSKCSESSFCHNEILKSFRQALEDLQSESPLKKLNQINRLVNNSLFYLDEDFSASGTDEWQTFRQSVRRGSGDCEDFAIVKRALLKKSGIKEETMFITVLKDNRQNRYHAVLTVVVEGQYFVLDVQNDMVWTDFMYPNYQPLYSLSASKSWIHGKQLVKQSADAAPSVLTGYKRKYYVRSARRTMYETKYQASSL